MPANRIPDIQNAPEHITLLRARRRITAQAKGLQAAYVVPSLVLPILAAIAVGLMPALQAPLAWFGILLVLLDVACLQYLLRLKLRQSAKLQEAFDTQVLDLSWNAFVAGDRVPPEVVRDATRTVGATEVDYFSNWYHRSVGDIPLPLARLVCQRTNIIYDQRLRKGYGALLVVGVALPVVVALTWGIVQDLTAAQVLVTLVVPLVPFVTWALREHARQRDAVETLERLRSEVDKLWSKAVSDADEVALTQGARQLQDALYLHRVSSPLVPDWFYLLKRSRNEDAAEHAALHYVEQAKKAFPEGVFA